MILFTTVVGSHMWKMEHMYSDLDLATVYMVNSRDSLLGKNIRGEQTFDDETNTDTTFYELGHFIHHLLKGNVNFLWAVMSPIIKADNRSSLKDLRGLVAANLSKASFYSINGLAKHNIYHFIKEKEHDGLWMKKLNVIGRTLKFGINLLIWGKCLFQKTNIKTEEELWELKAQLNEAFKNSMLPEKPDPKPFEDYLIKHRIKQMRRDKVI